MANLIEDNSYPTGIYQIETTDPVLGGAPNESTKAGLDNIPHLQLAWRTRWLKARVDQLLAQVVAATTLVAGVVKLNTSTSSTSTSEAATPSAVKAAMDNANGRAPATRSIGTGGLATGGGDLTTDRTITVPKSTQAQAEAGTDDSTAMTPLRVLQSIQARIKTATASVSGITRLNTSTSSTSTSEAATPSAVKAAMDNANGRVPTARTIGTAGLATGGGDLSANRTITVPKASLEQAQEGADDATVMTPRRVAQAIAAQVRAATTAAAGIVKLNTSTSSTSTSEAATPSAVKAAMDNANGRVPAARRVWTDGLATGGGSLEENRTIVVPKSSRGQAEEGSDDSTAMTPLRTAQAITTDRVRFAYAGAPIGGVGTLTMAYRSSTGALAAGATVAGSSLRRSGLERASDGVATIPANGPVLSGTWMLLCDLLASRTGTLGLYIRVD